jgi:phage shock protein PspC (stress-responsive transcriptional regulator)
VNKQLYRSRKDRVLGGVAGGLGRYFDTDPVLLRVLLVLGVVFTGGGLFFAYLVAWIIIPEEPSGAGSEGDSQDELNEMGQRIRRSAAEIADTGARVAKEVVAGLRGAKSDSQTPESTSGAPEYGTAYDRGQRKPSGESDDESQDTGSSNGARVLGFILIAGGAIVLFNKVSWRLFRADLTLPIVLIVLGLVVMLSGRRK